MVNRRPLDSPYSISTEFGVPDSAAKFRRHSGVDYAIPTGRDVLSPVNGTVTDYTWGEYHGNVVQIFDGLLYHRLLHNSRLLVLPGQRVSVGHVVAKSGSTGRGVTGPHIHWDISTEKFPSSFESFKDPAKWLAGEYNPKPEGGSMVLTEEAVRVLYRRLFGREGDPGGVKNYTGKTLDFALADMVGSQEFKNNHVKTVEKVVEKNTPGIAATPDQILGGQLVELIRRAK